MKSMYGMMFLLLVFMVSFDSLAQITITSTDVIGWYAVGKGQMEIQKSNDQTLYTFNVLSPSSTQSQAWVLPTVQYTDTMLIRNVLPGSTTYADSFPSATHARVIEISSGGVYAALYAYSRLVNDSLYSLGSVFRQQSTGVDTTTFDTFSQLTIKLPVNIGTVLPTTRDSSYYGPGNYEVSVSTEVVDGFGTITLPNGTFPALRIRDSSRYIKHTPPSTIDTITVIRYSWVTKEGHQGSVTCWRSDSTAGTVSVQEVRWMAVVSVPTSALTKRMMVPSSFQLLQNYPNPFNPSTVICYGLPERSRVRLEVCDVLGRVIETLVDREQEASSFAVTWRPAVPSGTYFYRLSATSIEDPSKRSVIVRKMLLLK